MPASSIKLGLQRREFRISGTAGQTRGFVAEDRTIEFPLSSEEPYERRHWERGRYLEILDHSPSSVRMGLITDAAPLLKDHWRDQQIGVIEDASIKSRRLVVKARFGNSAMALEEEKDVDDGIRTKVSVGYIVHEMVLEKKSEDGPDVYRVTDWEPVEGSTVAIPADSTVGIGRSQADDVYRDHETRVICREARQEGNTMLIDVRRLEDGVMLRIEESDFDVSLHERTEPLPAATAPAAIPASDPLVRSVTMAGSEPTPEERARQLQREAEADERERVRAIREIGSRHNCSRRAEEAITDGLPMALFRDMVWSSLPEGTILDDPTSHLGMSRNEARSYSLLRAIRAHVDRDWANAGFERECSQEIAQRTGNEPAGFFVPADTLYVDDDRLRSGLEQRDLEAGIAGDGGNIVATNLRPGNFIELLRNRSIVNRLGARMLPGLVGNVDIPRQASGAVAGWIAEKANAGTSELTLDLVQMSPKTIAVQSLMTRRLMLQSTPAIEGLVRADLFQAIMLGIDSAALQGSGAANQPRGILNTVGINSVALGTNGGAPTWADTVKLRSAAKAQNADAGNLGFAINANIWGTLMTTPKVAGFPNFILDDPGDRLVGRRVEESEQIPSNLTKGTGTNLSAMLYGNWADLLIGEWGTLDIMPDPYTQGGQAALIIRAFKDIDTTVRHPESFSATVDMITN